MLSLALSCSIEYIGERPIFEPAYIHINGSHDVDDMALMTMKLENGKNKHGGMKGT